ncbi:MAG: PAS domain S-box protein [bacterium]
MESSDEFESRERRAREREALLDAVMKAAVDAIVMIDERGRIELFSAAAERMFGWEPRDVVGRNVSVLMPEPYHSAHDGYLDHYLTTGIPRIIGIGRQVTAVRRDGTVFPVELSVGEIASFGEGRRFVGLIRDVSAKVRAEEEARVHRERLAHVTRLSTLGEMAAGIAHEVNQPLTAISVYAQALVRKMRRDPECPRERLETVEKIAEQALRAGEVLGRLRGFARKGDAKIGPCEVGSLVTDVLRLAEVDVRHHRATVQLEIAPDLPTVRADEIQIQQVVLNLVRNALESMDSQPAESRKLFVRASRPATDRVEIRVVDRGAGVATAAEEQMFHPFFSTKPENLGMGLSISHSIITAHGGSLTFARNPEGGSTFAFTLPVADGEEP